MKSYLVKPLIWMLLVISTVFNPVSGPTALCVHASSEPDITVYIHGERSRGGPIFNSSGSMGMLWAPGVKADGTLRLVNNYSSRIRVHNLAMSMRLERLDGENYKPVADATLYEAFAAAMKLTITRKTLGIFEDRIFDASFYEMLYVQGDAEHRGYDLPSSDKFNIGVNRSMDLMYAVYMDENAGNEMQGLRATVAFLLNARENPVSADTGGHGKDKQDKTGGNAAGAPEEPVNVIPDIEGHWAHDCIETLIRKGVIKGYSDGTIRPENDITRSEAAVLVGRALKLEEKDGPLTGYVDPIPRWSRGYIMAVSEKKIFNGYPGRTFKANKDISREEMAAVLIRAFNKYGDGSGELDFIDKESIGAWALTYVKAAAGNHIIEGYPDKTYRAKNSITRAEAFTMICKVMGWHEEHD